MLAVPNRPEGKRAIMGTRARAPAQKDRVARSSAFDERGFTRHVRFRTGSWCGTMCRVQSEVQRHWIIDFAETREYVALVDNNKINRSKFRLIDPSSEVTV